MSLHVWHVCISWQANPARIRPNCYTGLTLWRTMRAGFARLESPWDGSTHARWLRECVKLAPERKCRHSSSRASRVRNPALELNRRKANVANLSVFLLDRQAARCTAKTLEHYRYTCGSFVDWLRGRGVTSVAQITPHHIRVYLVSLQQRGRRDRGGVNLAANLHGGPFGFHEELALRPHPNARVGRPPCRCTRWPSGSPSCAGVRLPRGSPRPSPRP